jgi:hypothetical protein
MTLIKFSFCGCTTARAYRSSGEIRNEIDKIVDDPLNESYL